MHKNIRIITMHKRVRIVAGRVIPLGLLILALLAVGAGAAAGTILAGKVTGEMPVAVSQALLVENVTNVKSAVPADDSVVTQQVFDNFGNIHAANRFIGVKSDDNTAFQAAAELAVGDWTEINLQLKNASANDLVALLILDVPQGLEVEAFGDGAYVHNVTRVGPNTWKFIVKGGTNKSVAGSLLNLIVSVDDDAAPGYYGISGVLKQIAY